MAIAICLEVRDSEVLFASCVALAEAEAGLRLDADGCFHWTEPGTPVHLLEEALRLYAAPDPLIAGAPPSPPGEERLWLLRSTGFPPVQVYRAERRLDVDEAASVRVLDGDTIRQFLPGFVRHITVHIHGPATRLHAPEAVSGSAPGASAAPAPPPPPTIEWNLPPGVPV